MGKIKVFFKKNVGIAGLFDIFLVILGSFILALADIVFLVPFNLITGGLYSVGLTVQYFFDLNGIAFQVHDIVTGGLQVLLFLVGLFTLGKKFSVHTLIASFMYPLFYSVLFRTGFGRPIYEALMAIDGNVLGGDMSHIGLGLFLSAVLGGIGVGLGVALTFIGNGSTGGLDIISFVIYKYTKIKQSISTFALDASIIVIAWICMRDVSNIIPIALIGIISALLAALMVQVVYVAIDTYLVFDIVSDKADEIKQYILNEMDRSATLYSGTGAYSNDKKDVIRVVISRKEADTLTSFIASVDEKAFIIISNATTVKGEGFLPLKVSRRWKVFASSKQKNIKKDNDGE